MHFCLTLSLVLLLLVFAQNESEDDYYMANFCTLSGSAIDNPSLGGLRELHMDFVAPDGLPVPNSVIDRNLITLVFLGTNVTFSYSGEGRVTISFMYRQASKLDLGAMYEQKHCRNSPVKLEILPYEVSWDPAVPPIQSRAPPPRPPNFKLWPKLHHPSAFSTVATQDMGELANQPGMRAAYATLITTDSYVTGAILLVHSLRLTGSEKHIVVLVTPDISERGRVVLHKAGCEVREVPHISNPNKDMDDRWDTVYAKLNLWSITDYDLLVYLDADMVVLQNLDHLFAARELTAAPDFYMVSGFNTGLMVLEPNEHTYRDMLEKRLVMLSSEGSDQGFINQYFCDKWTGLHPSYNLQRIDYPGNDKSYTWFWSGKDDGHPRLRIMHYTRRKPWHCDRHYDCYDPEPYMAYLLGADYFKEHFLWWKIWDKMCAPGTGYICDPTPR